MTKENNFSQYFSYLALITAILLIIPWLAMQVTAEVNWAPADFVFAGVMVFGTGTAFKLITSKFSTLLYKIAVGIALVSGFILIWINGAIGIIGAESNAFNLLYYLLILAGIIGALISRFKPEGLSYTMFFLAVAQTVLMISAFLSGMENIPESSVLEIVGVNAFFILLFVISGLLFFRAAKIATTNELEESPS